MKAVASASTWKPMYVANDSLSHTSSHQAMVTRSPNHMWAISCAMTIAAGLPFGLGDRGREQELVAEGDAARVLHRAGLELGDERLVVGVKGYGSAKISR